MGVAFLRLEANNMADVFWDMKLHYEKCILGYGTML
jgi:hypothetical protein